jgi:hypothetical protein
MSAFQVSVVPRSSDSSVRFSACVAAGCSARRDPRRRLDPCRDVVVAEDGAENDRKQLLQVGEVDGVVDVRERVGVTPADRDPHLHGGAV